MLVICRVTGSNKHMPAARLVKQAVEKVGCDSVTQIRFSCRVLGGRRRCADRMRRRGDVLVRGHRGARSSQASDPGDPARRHRRSGVGPLGLLVTSDFSSSVASICFLRCRAEQCCSPLATREHLIWAGGLSPSDPGCSLIPGSGSSSLFKFRLFWKSCG
jgi:hypothetical protein